MCLSCSTNCLTFANSCNVARLKTIVICATKFYIEEVLGQNSKAKRDKKKKKSVSRVKPTKNKFLEDSALLKKEFNKLVKPKKLTTPTNIDHNVKKFAKTIRDHDPFFVDVLPEDWCRKANCDMNVEKFIEQNGGEIICGYKIWYNKSEYIEGERHAIWKLDDQYRDLTFNEHGESKIVFVKDIATKQKGLDLNEMRYRYPISSKARKVIQAYEKLYENQIQIQKASREEAWKSQPTFSEWKANNNV